MHERKARMSELSDAFVMLPGGFGTYEEFMESVTWAQLGIHDKPCGILNVDGFFDDLLTFVRHAVTQGFIKARQVDALVIAGDVDELLTSARGDPRSGLGPVGDAGPGAVSAGCGPFDQRRPLGGTAWIALLVGQAETADQNSTRHGCAQGRPVGHRRASVPPGTGPGRAGRPALRRTIAPPC